MSPITKYYTQSELAYAAYADMLPGVDPVPALTGDTVGMPETQATNFAENWQVVDQFNDELRPGYVGLYSGLSVTLFENRDSGDQVVAIRGTNDLKDVGTDIEDVLLRGSGKHQAQYSALTDKVQEWLDDGTLQTGFSVTGHSLGGFLAQLLTIDRAAVVSVADTLNAAGIGRVSQMNCDRVPDVAGRSGVAA